MILSKQHSAVRPRRRLALLAAAAAAAPLIASAANTDNYVGASGTNWNNSNDWVINGTTTHVIPTTGDSVFITLSPSSLFSVTFDGSYTSLTAISSLTLDGSSTLGVVLNQTTAGDNLFAGNETFGNTGIGTYNQTAATNSFTGSMYLGYASTGQGTYLLGSGATLLASNNNVIDGVSGNGTINQTGGTANIFTLALGAGATGHGLYTLSSTGTLVVDSQEFVGYGGVGSFVQSGGTHAEASGAALYIGNFNNSKGIYVLSGGSLATYQISVGYQGIGTFSQSGGTHSIATFLNVGDQPVIGSLTAGVGLYTLAAGSLSSPVENIGYGGTGTFVQTGGTNTTSNLTIASQSASAGSYSLSGTGVLNAQNTVEIVGNQAIGSFIQSGGTNSVGSTGQIWIAASAGSQGVYNLSGGTVIAQSVAVGGGTLAGGTGALNVSGSGSLTLTGELGVFNNGSSISLSGGSISVGELNTRNVPANFNWTGGSLILTASNVVFDTNASGTSASLGSALTLGSGQSLQVIGGSESIGGAGAGSLTLQSGSSNTVVGAATINPLGNLTLNGGTFTPTSGTLLNLGNLTFNAGTLSGRLINRGTVTLAGASNFSPSNGIENDTSLTIPAGVTVTANGSGLDNLGTLSLNSGTIAGGAVVTNDYGGVMYASGTLNQGLTNNGTLNLNGALTSNGATSNTGVINLPSATILRGSGSITNTGLVNLSGGAINSALTNSTGGVIQGYGALTNFQSNTAGGQISLPASGPALNITNAWTNAGLVILQGGAALLSGGAITNAGTVQGSGQVSATVLNTTGAIQPSGGQLVIAGAGNTNAASGQLQITSGNTLFYSQGLSTNSGTIALSGGTFDNNNQPLTNNGFISGNGTIRTGNLTNSISGTISLADVASNILGTVSNSGHLNITNNTTTFYGAVTNNSGGLVKVTSGVSRFLSTFTNDGTYNSDPADNYFTDLNISTTGALQGGSGDRFFISGNFTSSSTQNNAWNTASSLFDLQGATVHSFSVTGTDEGPATSGYVNNFAIGTLQLDSGGSLSLKPGGPNSALYVEAMSLADGLSQISSISGNGANLYYDPSNPANAYLNDQTYGLSGGGAIAPVPEPAGGLLIGIAGVLLARRRRALRKLNLSSVHQKC